MRKSVSLILGLVFASFIATADDKLERVPIDLSSASTESVGATEKAKTAVVSKPAWATHLFIDSCLATNNSGSSADVGCARKLPDSAWTEWEIDASDTPDATDDTTDAQDAGTGDFILFTITNNDGHMICADKKFGAIGYTVSQDDATNGTYALSYYNGSTFASLTAIQAITDWTVADHVLTFPAPNDWAVGSTVAVGGPADSDQYCLQVIATTAPSQETLGTIAWVMVFEHYLRSVADKGGFYRGWGDPLHLLTGESFLCYFSNADVDNTCQVNWRAK